MPERAKEISAASKRQRALHCASRKAGFFFAPAKRPGALGRVSLPRQRIDECGSNAEA